MWSEIWEMSVCKWRETSPVRAPTKVSLSSFLLLFLVPFSAPSLLFSPSLVSPFLFFSHTLRPGGWRGFGCTCGVAESLLKESMCFERSLESQASLCLSMSYSLPRSLSPRLCLPARRLPAPFDLMLCRTQHGLNNDTSLKAYIWVIKIIPLFPVLLVFCEWIVPV